MKKAAGHISVILKGILCIGFSIQIVFGIVWMCFNFAHLQAFQQDSGILYRGLKGLVGNCFGCFLAFMRQTDSCRKYIR